MMRTLKGNMKIGGYMLNRLSLRCLSPTKRNWLDGLRMDLLLLDIFCQEFIIKRITWERFACGSKLCYHLLECLESIIWRSK